MKTNTNNRFRKKIFCQLFARQHPIFQLDDEHKVYTEPFNDEFLKVFFIDKYQSERGSSWNLPLTETYIEEFGLGKGELNQLAIDYLQEKFINKNKVIVEPVVKRGKTIFNVRTDYSYFRGLLNVDTFWQRYAANFRDKKFYLAFPDEAILLTSDTDEGNKQFLLQETKKRYDGKYSKRIYLWADGKWVVDSVI